MNLQAFFAVASPTTLASLIADVHALGKGATSAEMRLACDAESLLRDNVGEVEAAQMIDAAMKLIGTA